MTAQAMFNLRIGPVGADGRASVDLGMAVTEPMIDAAVKALAASGVLPDASISTRSAVREALQAALDAG